MIAENLFRNHRVRREYAMKTVFFSEAFKNIKKNLITSFLLILCFILLFIIFAETSMHAVLKNISGERADMASLIDYTEIEMVPFTNLSPMRQAVVLSSMLPEEQLAAGRAMDNIISVLRDKFGAFECVSIQSIYGPEPRYEIMGEYCSYDFYAVSSSMLIIKEGEWFEKKDFNRSEQTKKGYIAPVVLGAKFAEKYGLSVGDTFIADMIFDEEQRKVIDEYGFEEGQTYNWKVIGVFEKDSSYLYRGQVHPVNNIAILPFYYLPTLDEVLEENNGEINDSVLSYIGTEFTFFRNTDFFIKSDDMKDALDFVNEEIANNGFLSQYYIARESNDSIKMAAQNQAKASDFYNAVAIITYIISVFGIMMSVYTKIQNNKRNYAIHSLNGATVYDLIMCSITEIALLMIIADAFFFAVPYILYYHRVTIGNGIYVGRESFIFVLAVNFATLVFAIGVSAFVLRKFDTAVYLKKKE
jgi:hypothetical protein